MCATAHVYRNGHVASHKSVHQQHSRHNRRSVQQTQAHAHTCRWCPASSTPTSAPTTHTVVIITSTSTICRPRAVIVHERTRCIATLSCVWRSVAPGNGGITEVCQEVMPGSCSPHMFADAGAGVVASSASQPVLACLLPCADVPMRQCACAPCPCDLTRSHTVRRCSPRDEAWKRHPAALPAPQLHCVPEGPSWAHPRP